MRERLCVRIEVIQRIEIAAAGEQNEETVGSPDDAAGAGAADFPGIPARDADDRQRLRARAFVVRQHVADRERVPERNSARRATGLDHAAAVGLGTRRGVEIDVDLVLHPGGGAHFAVEHEFVPIERQSVGMGIVVEGICERVGVDETPVTLQAAVPIWRQVDDIAAFAENTDGRVVVHHVDAVAGEFDRVLRAVAQVDDFDA